MNKHQLRESMKLFLSGISAEDRHSRSLAACHQLMSTKEFKQAQTIMLFLAMPSEIETTTLAVKAWAECKNIAVPRTDWASHKMEPIQITSLETDLASNKFGIREPTQGIAVPLGVIDMVVIPGLAFDRHGFRVGRGRGYYDRFLSQQEFKGTRCALCFHQQLTEFPIPCEPHDIPMNLIVTDKEVVRCSSRHSGHRPTHQPAQ